MSGRQKACKKKDRQEYSPAVFFVNYHILIGQKKVCKYYIYKEYYEERNNFMDLQKFKDKMQTENALPLNILLDEAVQCVHKNGSAEIDAAGELMQDIEDKFGMIKMISKDLRTREMPVDDNPVKLTYNKIICIEELTEFATAIIDYESCCSGSDTDETVREHNEKLIDKKYALLEEFADVMICLSLMKKAYGLTDEMISKAVRIKLDNYKQKKKEKK